MFETSFVKERVAPQRRAGFFVASVIAHTVVVAGVVIATATATTLPTNAPNDLIKVYVAPADIPLPKGNPDAPRQPQQQPPQQQAPQQHAQQTAPATPTTPTVIPDSTPMAQTSTTGDALPGNGTPGTSERWGTPDGDPNGIDIGQSPNTIGTGVPDVIYQPGVDVKPATVLFRVQPQYPPAAMRAKMPGWVVVKCVISKTGEVRDVEVVKGSMGMFEQPALDALRQWKFAPGYFRGQPVDTYFELKITFEVR